MDEENEENNEDKTEEKKEEKKEEKTEEKTEEKIDEKKDLYYCFVEYSDKKILHVNLNCLSKLIYEYVRVKVSIPEQYEMDLIDLDGKATYIYLAAEGKFGYELLEDKQTYYVIVLQRNKFGQVSNPRPVLPSLSSKFSKVLGLALSSYRRESQETLPVSIGSNESESKKSKFKNRKKTMFGKL